VIRAARAVVALVAVAAAVASAACASTDADPRNRPPELVHVTRVAEDAKPRVLCVVAHPDDEIAFAGTIYKTATFLGGTVDLFTVTNGEGGFKYSTLAERIYGTELTDETVGRRELPEIRKRELTRGCRVLGIRNLWFLREKDHRYTQDLDEVLGPTADAWNLDRVARQLDLRLASGHYDFVLVHLPTAGTHAHHMAASVLALEAVARMPVEERPAVLGARILVDGEPAAEAATFPADSRAAAAVRVAADAPAFVFDRRQKFGHQDKLDYGIVVAWAVAEHRSQGTMQLYAHRGDREEYTLFAGGPPDGASRAATWFEALRRPQFRARVYGESAGTNR